MNETLTALVIVLAAILLGGGIAGIVFLGRQMLETARAMRMSARALQHQTEQWERVQRAQQEQQLKFADLTLSELRNALVKVGEALNTVHEAQGMIVEEFQRMHQRREAAVANGIRQYQRPPMPGEPPPGEMPLDANGQPIPWSPTWDPNAKSPRAQEEEALKEAAALENDSWRRGI